jgi:gas vesicle protein
VVGGAVGATTGTIAATTSGKKQVAIPTEAVLTFTVQ